jgi:hypothetical protein
MSTVKPQFSGRYVHLKSGRSAVRSRPWPPTSVQVVGSDAALDTARDRTNGPIMRPIYGQVADWPYDRRSLATSRRTTSPGRLLGIARHPRRKRRNCGRAAIAQLFGHIEGLALSVTGPPATVVRGKTYRPLEVAERVERRGDIVQLVVKEVGVSEAT